MSESPTKHDAYAALRHANYQRFAGGFLLSSTGLQMLTLAVSWEVWERTKDPMHSGYIGLARALPVILLALPAGYLIDSFDRKKVLAITQFAFSAVVLGLCAASYLQAPLWVTYVLLALSGCARVFNGPSRATLLPQLVPMRDFQNATSWNSGVFQLSAVGGPILAGILLETTRAAWPVYAVTAAACVAFGFLSLALQPTRTHREPEQLSWSGVTAGMSHLWNEKTILGAITLDLFAVLLGGATALLPMFAEQILHTNAIGLGVLRSSAYVGAFAMAIYLAHRPAFTRAGPALLWSVAAFGISIVIFGYSTNFWLSVAALAVGGAADNISVVVRHVLVQVRTPEHLRGRVSSVNSVFIESSNEIGAFESGIVAAAFGPVTSVVAGGIGTLAVVGAVAAWIPQLRRLGRLDEPPEPTPQLHSTNADEGK